MKYLFDINYTVFTFMDYPMSLAEILGTLFGLWSVILAAKAKVSNYSIGIINIIFFFVIFYQVQMYSDMFLQVYFLIVSIYGWWRWMHPKAGEEDLNNQLKVSTNDYKTNIYYGIGIIIGVIAFGTLMKNIHLLLPELFKLPAAFPYYDSFVAVGSVVAMYLMAKKKLECWVLWVSVDVFCIALYFAKNIKLMSIEYFVFLIISTVGLISWLKEYKGYGESATDVQPNM